MGDSSDLHQRIAELEQQLKQSRQLVAATRARRAEYDMIFSLLGDFGFVYRINAEGAFVREWLSGSFEQVTGYEIATLGKVNDWFDLLHPSEMDRATEFKDALLSGNQMMDEFRIVDGQGETRWLRYMMQPVWNRNRTQVVRVYGAGHDITDEQAIQTQQAQFITHAMHELSHPVSSILMRLYLIRKQPEKLDEHLNALHPVTEQIRRMIDDMREVSYLDRRLVTLELRDLMLQDVMRDVIRTHSAAAANRQIQIDLEMDPDPLPLHADVERLTRAFKHLITNVINVSPTEENIKIRVYPALPHYAICEIEHQREAVEGENPSVVFHPFSRPSQGHITHTGLELSIARSVIKLHGGDLALAIGDGNRGIFTVRLKLAGAGE